MNKLEISDKKTVAVYIPPHKRENKSPLVNNIEKNITVVSEIDIERLKKIGGKIKNLHGIIDLIKFAINPTLNREIVTLNDKHWALWISKISQISSYSENQKDIFISKRNKENIIMIFENKIAKINCEAGTFSQIIKGFGNLQLSCNSDTNKWIINNFNKNINKFNAQELYMFIHGAIKIFSRKDLKLIIKKYNANLNFEMKEDIKENLKPQGIACILKACAIVKADNNLSDLLINLVIEKYSKFSFQEKIDLITGFSHISYDTSKPALKYLNKIEQSLAFENPSLKPLSIALSSFASCGYIPKLLLHDINSLLDSETTHLWGKISLLHSLAMLGLTKFYPQFATLLLEINQSDDNGRRKFTNIYCSDLARLIHAAAVFLPDQDAIPDVITDIITYLKSNINLLKPEDKKHLYASLCALGHIETASSFREDFEPPFIGETQTAIKNTIQSYFMKHPSFSALKVEQKTCVNDLYVEILITGFEVLNIQQKPIILAIDSRHRHACNDSNHDLAKNILRSKTLKKDNNYEIVIINVEDSIEDPIEIMTNKALKYIELKSNEWLSK